MKRLLIVWFLVGAPLWAFGYSNSQVTLALGFTAKEMCSCVFVSGRTEAQCREYVKLDALSPHISVDTRRKRVSASAYVIFRKRASFEGPGLGCRLH